MDWLFNPLAKFFLWTFTIIEGLSWKFNLLMFVVGLILIGYWIMRMYKDRSDTKGLFRKS